MYRVCTYDLTNSLYYIKLKRLFKQSHMMIKPDRTKVYHKWGLFTVNNGLERQKSHIYWFLYSVLSFCFHHFLINIFLINVNTFVPKLCLSTRTTPPPIFSVLKRQLYHFRFQYKLKIESQKGILHCKQMKNTQITLNNCARCPEYFRMEKRCIEHFPL